MRHLILLIFLACVLYVGWQFVPLDVRAQARKIALHHGPRLGLIIGVILGIALLIYLLPAFNLM